MSSASTAPIESKSAKKRKAKAEAAASTASGAATPTVEANPTEPHTNGNETQGESSYIRELTKNIRNIHKKLASSSKADAVIAENPGVALDDLVAQKKLNADQKAQILKKPALQAQITQLEEQLNTFKSFAQDLEDKTAKDRSKLTEAHEAELLAAKEKAEKAAQDATESQAKAVEDGLRVISHFLHAAASKRQSEDADTEEGRAFEGTLLLVYQGNEASLSTLKNLVNGADEKVPDVNGDLLEVTFAQVKESALRSARDLAEPTEAEIDQVQPDVSQVQTDTTVANAGLTELDDTTTVPSTQDSAEVEPVVAPLQSSTGDEAANAVAETSWDPQASVVTENSANNDEWVKVPRDPAETETGVAATPAANHGTTSWAEEAGAAAASEEKAVAENDGFEQVKRDRGRGRGGRGPRGDFRGGRGRGGGRGGDGHRGGRGGPPRGRGGPRGGGSNGTVAGDKS